MQKEFLDSFEGKKNVWHIILDNGTESWITQEVSFADETTAKGACKLNTVENETKHVLFLFNDRNEEVGRYYIGKKLQGKTPEQITELKGQICFFESWNPSTKSWVPCIRLGKPLLSTIPNTSKTNECDTHYLDMLSSNKISKREYIGSYAGKTNVVAITENGSVIYMSKPRSYAMESKIKNAFTLETYKSEIGHQLCLLSSNRQVVGIYSMSKEIRSWLPGKVIDRNMLGFCDVYDTKNETWIACVGYKVKLYSYYYDEVIMSFINKTQSVKFAEEDPNLEFDNALYQRTNEDLIVLKEICLNEISAITGIQYGLLDWETHLKNANIICKNYHIEEINMMLTGFEKRLFFWSFLLEEVRDHQERIESYFHKNIQSYSEENLKKLIDYYNTWCKYKWVISNVLNPNASDPETEIMSALSHGDGDSVGF